ncbi:c-type cytochrome [Polaromonas sp.]|uniref:c-type cytochrome n=1 Tax=Polaromonas sp. TaxID=1869339 RepID=UPI0025E5B381|nr:c-type cytochrome [Polaromonas sp.]
MRIALFMALLVSLTACFDSTAPANVALKTSSVAQPAATPNDHELGRSIYNFRCYFCHGYSGDAQTLASSYLEPRPRDFNATSADKLSRDSMLDAVKNGRSGTAMKGFEGILKPAEIALVTDFVRREFMIDKSPNTRYHTTENGWPNHERYAAAFPFATGTIMLDAPVESMTPEQRAGRRLFMSSCVSCHDRAKVSEPGAPWESRPLSYPRNGFSPGDNYASPGRTGPGATPGVDAVTSATPYHLHDKVPQLAGLSAQQRMGESLYQENCAFCHAADGTGRNWIGSFLEPHPRDLTSKVVMSAMTPERLSGVIRDGLPETSMPAWKSVLKEDEIEAVVAYVGRAFHPLSQSPSVAASGAR